MNGREGRHGRARGGKQDEGFTETRTRGSTNRCWHRCSELWTWDRKFNLAVILTTCLFSFLFSKIEFSSNSNSSPGLFSFDCNVSDPSVSGVSKALFKCCKSSTSASKIDIFILGDSHSRHHLPLAKKLSEKLENQKKLVIEYKKIIPTLRQSFQTEKAKEAADALRNLDMIS